MKFLKKYVDILILMALVIGLFLCKESLFSKSVYMIIGSVFSILFFPILFIREFKRRTKLELFSLFFISCVICMSIIGLYVAHRSNFKLIVLGFQILNIVLLLMKTQNTEQSKLLLHVFIGLLIAGTYFSE
jgi:hypothetical protein